MKSDGVKGTAPQKKLAVNLGYRAEVVYPSGDIGEWLAKCGIYERDIYTGERKHG